MKKRDIWISVAIIAAAVLFLFLSLQKKGQIQIDAGDAVATLRLSGSWLGNAMINSAVQPSKVSARLHRPQWLKLSMKQGGDTWRLETRGPWGDLSTIRVKNNDTTVLKLGPPFQIKTKTLYTGSKVSIDFNIIGKAGEHYRNVITQNNKRASAPGVKIIDEDGNVLASGKFEYG
ncbi:MAG: hypothetical protein H8D56_02610 [Planctomycetes bacterium]|nr:hypothetical protein [Planctomycetota bacterium]MBL7146611.1 hypothetical protein [Phycisphaerae bacterium]